VLVAAVVATTAIAFADKDGGKAPPPVQKPVSGAYLDSLLGTWTTDTTSDMGSAKGKTTFAKAAAGTAILETCDGTAELKGTTLQVGAVGIYKVSEDGKNLTIWWIDNMLPEPLKGTGPLTDSGFEISVDHPQHDSFVIKMSKTPDGHALKVIEDGKETATQTFRRASS
jgi:hypothetical protein